MSLINVFNNSSSKSDYIISKDKMIVNNELERIWKETVVVQFKILPQHLPEMTEENHEQSSRIVSVL
jgi:hypothetical protein